MQTRKRTAAPAPWLKEVLTKVPRATRGRGIGASKTDAWSLGIERGSDDEATTLDGANVQRKTVGIRGRSDKEKQFDNSIRFFKPVDQYIDSAVFYKHYQTTMTNDLINALIRPIINSKNLHFNNFKRVYKACDFSLIHYCNKRGLPRIAYQQVVFKVVIELFVYHFDKILDAISSPAYRKGESRGGKDAAHVILVYALYVLHQTQSPFESVASTRGASGNVMKMEEQFIKSNGGLGGDYNSLHPIRISLKEFSYMNSFITYLMANKVEVGIHAIQLWHRMLLTNALQIALNSGPHGVPLRPPKGSLEVVSNVRGASGNNSGSDDIPLYHSCDDNSRFFLSDVSMLDEQAKYQHIEGGQSMDRNTGSSSNNLDKIFQRRSEFIKKQNKAVGRSAHALMGVKAESSKVVPSTVNTISPADSKAKSSSSCRKETPTSNTALSQVRSPVFDSSAIAAGDCDSGILMDFFEFLNQPNIPVVMTTTRQKITASNVFESTNAILRLLNFNGSSSSSSSSSGGGSGLVENRRDNNRSDDKVERVQKLLDSLKFLVF